MYSKAAIRAYGAGRVADGLGELLDLDGQGWRRQVQLLSGAGEAHVPGHGIEDLELVQGRMVDGHV